MQQCRHWWELFPMRMVTWWSFPFPSRSFPIPIPMICLIFVPIPIGFPWNSHGIPILMGIPFPWLFTMILPVIECETRCQLRSVWRWLYAFEASVEGTFMCNSQSRRRVSCFRVVHSAVRLLTYIPDDAISLHLEEWIWVKLDTNIHHVSGIVEKELNE